MSIAVVENGQATMGEDIAKPIRERINQGREHRKQFELGWQQDLAFAKGQQWLIADRDTRTLRRVQDVDPRYKNRELYQADVIQEYRGSMLGELGSEDDRPELLLQRDDQASEDFQAQANRAVGWGWDFQWLGDEIIAEADGLCLDMGTSAIRCRYDNTVGPELAGDIPHQDGKPLLDLEQARAAVMDAAQNGRTLQYKTIHEGRICWEALSAFNLIVPPGITRERYFPWECVVRPVLLSEVKERWPKVTGDLKEDRDIGSTLGTAMSGSGVSGTIETRNSRLRDHVWIFTYYERPTTKYPKGRVLVFAGNQLKLIHVDNELPYVAPDGTYRSGISYFHWWRVSDRFWSRSLISAMEDGQRMINRRGTQKNELIDRNMPFIMVDRASKAQDRAGVPMEFVELEASERTPVIFSGMGLTDAFYRDIEQIRDDIEHATGIKGPRLGENPQNITTFSQLSLVNETEQIKREMILSARKKAIAHLVEDSVYDIRTYWGPNKQIMLAGDEDKIDAEVFDATKIPPFYIVNTAKGSAKPRSQAARLKMVEDIAAFSLRTPQPVPTSWFKDSLEAGEPLDLPEQAADEQSDKAELENHLMLQGHEVPVTYYDPPDVHIALHRGAQIQAELTGDENAWQVLERHVQQHLQAVAFQAAKTQALQAGGPVAAPGVPQPPGLPPTDPGNPPVLPTPPMPTPGGP